MLLFGAHAAYSVVSPVRPSSFISLLAAVLVAEQALELLAEARRVAQRALERGERGAQIEQLLQLGHLRHDASGSKSVSDLNLSLTASSASVVARQLVRRRWLRGPASARQHFGEVVLVDVDRLAILERGVVWRPV